MSRLIRYALEELEIDKAIQGVNALDMNTSEDVAINSEVQRTQEEESVEVTDDGITPDTGEVIPEGDNQNTDDTGNQSTGEVEDTDTNTEKETKEDSSDEVSDDDSVTVSAVPETEEDKEAAKDSVAVENIMKLISSAVISCKSLEEIADIIENASEENGISPVAATMIETTTGELYSQLGIDSEQAPQVVTESIEVYSYRVNYAKEALTDIKNKIVEIFNAIITFIRKVYSYIKKLIISFTNNVSDEVKSVKEMRTAFSNIVRDTATAKELTGIYPTYLFSKSSDKTASDALNVCETTIKLMTSLSESFPKRGEVSYDAITDLYSDERKKIIAKAANTDLAPPALTDEIIQNILGGKLPSELKVVTQLPGIKIPIGKYGIYSTGEIFGGNFIYCLFPKEVDSFINSKLDIEKDPAFKPNKTITVLTKTEIVTALDNCEKVLNVRLKLLTSLNDTNEVFEKLDKLCKLASKNLSNNDLQETDTRKLALLLSTCIKASASCNINPIKKLNDYMNKYSKCLIHYTRTCIKLYL